MSRLMVGRILCSSGSGFGSAVRGAGLLLALLFGAACAEESPAEMNAKGAVVAGGAALARPISGEPMLERVASAPAAMITADMAVAPSSPVAPDAASVSQIAVTQGMVIRNGHASIEVDSLELGIAAVQRMAAAFGGYVGNTSLAAGDNQVRSATIELKIPAARFDEALAGLKPIGKVESVNSTAEDVGEEFVDVTARVTNAKRLEERLITLLATRTGKLEDVLAVERELARVREEIERYEGRLRFLKSRVATSTLTVTVHERVPLVSRAPGENVIVEAMKQAWRNFVRFVASIIASLGIVIPVALLLALAVVVWRRWRRRSS